MHVPDSGQTSSFMVGSIPIYGGKILSPMAGYSDQPYRAICRGLGSAISYTEFVSVDAILHRDGKALKRLAYTPHERPVTFQIFGSDPEKIVEAARQIETFGPDIIDLNMGCSVNEVAMKGAGAGLLLTPSKIGRIFSGLSRHLRVPVTGKIRLGWDDQAKKGKVYLEILRAMQENGAKLVAVHGRTKLQGYAGPADWIHIGLLKSAASIPVVGNGDIRSAGDATRMKAETGCDAVMIGRAAIGNPWIFAGKDSRSVTISEKLVMVRAHFASAVSFYGREPGLKLFRKHVAKYITGFEHARELRMSLVMAESVDEFVDIVSRCEAQVRPLAA